MRRGKKKPHLRPKRRVWRRLGPFRSSTPSTSLPVLIFHSLHVIYAIKVQLVTKKHEGEKKDSPRAHTTRLTSFGPIFIVPVAYFNIRSYIFNTTLVSMSKYNEKMKNTHLRSKRRTLRRLDPLSLSLPSRSHISIVGPMLNKAFVSI